MQENNLEAVRDALKIDALDIKELDIHRERKKLKSQFKEKFGMDFDEYKAKFEIK